MLFIYLASKHEGYTQKVLGKEGYYGLFEESIKKVIRKNPSILIYIDSQFKDGAKDLFDDGEYLELCMTALYKEIKRDPKCIEFDFSILEFAKETFGKKFSDELYSKFVDCWCNKVYKPGYFF